MTNIAFLNLLYLRGLQGIIEDLFLKRLLGTSPAGGTEAFNNFLEAKNMAIQLYFQMKGYGL